MKEILENLEKLHKKGAKGLIYELECCPATYYNLKNEVRQPTPQMARKIIMIARSLGLTIDFNDIYFFELKN